MATMRAIRPSLFSDAFIGSLSYKLRWLWIGLFTVMADDQGRFWANPLRIRAELFLFERDQEVTDEDIKKGIETFVQAGKMVMYKHDGKVICQFVNWWDHQRPRWAAKSEYPPPPETDEGVEWKDRIRYNAKGGEVKRNWGIPGGYCENNVEERAELEF